MTSIWSSAVFLSNFRVTRALTVKKEKEESWIRVLDWQYGRLRPYCPVSYWPNIFLNMSGRGRCVDERVAHTVAFLLRCPGSSVPEAMRACKYTLEEIGDPAKQMVIRRSFAKATGGTAKTPPPNVIDALTVGTTTVSPLTNHTSTVGHPSTPTSPRTPWTIDKWTNN